MISDTKHTLPAGAYPSGGLEAQASPRRRVCGRVAVSIAIGYVLFAPYLNSLGQGSWAPPRLAGPHGAYRRSRNLQMWPLTSPRAGRGAPVADTAPTIGIPSNRAFPASLSSVQASVRASPRRGGARCTTASCRPTTPAIRSRKGTRLRADVRAGRLRARAWRTGTARQTPRYNLLQPATARIRRVVSLERARCRNVHSGAAHARHVTRRSRRRGWTAPRTSHTGSRLLRLPTTFPFHFFPDYRSFLLV